MKNAGMKWDYLFSLTNHVAVSSGSVIMFVTAQANSNVKRVVLSGELQRAPAYSTTFTQIAAFNSHNSSANISHVSSGSAVTHHYRFRSSITLTLYDADSNVLETIHHTAAGTSRKDWTDTEFHALITEALTVT